MCTIFKIYSQPIKYLSYLKFILAWNSFPLKSVKKNPHAPRFLEQDDEYCFCRESKSGKSTQYWYEALRESQAFNSHFQLWNYYPVFWGSQTDPVILKIQ